MRPRVLIATAFVVSGVAGLVYEVLWARYLGIFVGHSAYAQVIVLSVYLGGMAVGSLSVAGLSKRVTSPLLWYAGAELILAAFGIAFHPAFTTITEWSYATLFPALSEPRLVSSVRWGLAGLLVLPQAITLGATFPLMAAGLVRSDPSHPSSGIAWTYLLNSIGGALGVLLAGFILIGSLGLAGTSLAASGLNILAAVCVIAAVRRARSAAAPTTPSQPEAGVQTRDPQPLEGDGATRTLLLVVAFATALASFCYEVGWVRMLSLVLGSATHAFELMLSAFIFGLAAGAWSIRRKGDATAAPLRLLGNVQVAMGLTALASLPLYLLTFRMMAELVTLLADQPSGYGWFNLARYGLCLLVMLPSTFLAGMTLPLITGTLLRRGHGEATIGRVYGANTLGAVVGVVLAGLIALPMLGLKYLIVFGAALDVLLGLWILAGQRGEAAQARRYLKPLVAACLLMFAGTAGAIRLDPLLVTSGVYRDGEIPGSDRWLPLYYHDGRTATVSAHVDAGVIILSTNGKPDASLGSLWVRPGRDTLPVAQLPEGRDYTTQVLSPTIALAHNPGARSIANIGHGSGLSAATFLTDPEVERVVTIEIEPSMITGSLAFLPANGPAFADERASFVLDDAKSYFAYRPERFDIIFAEPSNPWVSGTSSLFTKEFYQRILPTLSDDGVLAQWIQLYELTDELFLGVLAAIDEVFPSYRAYLVGDSDVAIFAGREGVVGDPDWSILEEDGFLRFTAGIPPFAPQHLGTLFLFDQNTLRPLLETEVSANSDFFPTLDLQAERARFERESARGVFSFASSRVNLARIRSGLVVPPFGHRTVPARGLLPVMLAERGAWVRSAVWAAGLIAPPEGHPDWFDDVLGIRTLVATPPDDDPAAWEGWARTFVLAEGILHWGTWGWVDTEFYTRIDRILEAGDPPLEAVATVQLMRSHALGDWEGGAEASDVLVPALDAGGQWVTPDILLDIAVVSYLETGRPDHALDALDRLTRRTGRTERDARIRLLRAWAEETARR